MAALGLNRSLGTPQIDGILCSAPAAYDKWPGIDFYLIDNLVNLFAEFQVGQEGEISLARVTARGQQRLPGDGGGPPIVSCLRPLWKPGSDTSQIWDP